MKTHKHRTIGCIAGAIQIATFWFSLAPSELLASDSPKYAEEQSEKCFSLWYRRNEIFANEGKCFDSYLGKSIFSSYDCSEAFYFSNLDKETKRAVEDMQILERGLGCSLFPKLWEQSYKATGGAGGMSFREPSLSQHVRQIEARIIETTGLTGLRPAWDEDNTLIWEADPDTIEYETMDFVSSLGSSLGFVQSGDIKRRNCYIFQFDIVTPCITPFSPRLEVPSAEIVQSQWISIPPYTPTVRTTEDWRPIVYELDPLDPPNWDEIILQPRESQDAVTKIDGESLIYSYAPIELVKNGKEFITKYTRLARLRSQLRRDLESPCTTNDLVCYTLNRSDTALSMCAYLGQSGRAIGAPLDCIDLVRMAGGKTGVRVIAFNYSGGADGQPDFRLSQSAGETFNLGKVVEAALSKFQFGPDDRSRGFQVSRRMFGAGVFVSGTLSGVYFEPAQKRLTASVYAFIDHDQRGLSFGSQQYMSQEAIFCEDSPDRCTAATDSEIRAFLGRFMGVFYQELADQVCSHGGSFVFSVTKEGDRALMPVEYTGEKMVSCRTPSASSLQ